MHERAMRDLMAAVIEQAIDDRRSSFTHGLVDKLGNQIGGPKAGGRNDKWSAISGLNFFFYHGGIETIAEMAEFRLNLKMLKEISEQPYEKKSEEERRNSRVQRTPWGKSQRKQVRPNQKVSRIVAAPNGATG